VAVAKRTGVELHPVLVHLTDLAPRLIAAGEPAPAADGALELREIEYLESVANVLSGRGCPVRPPVVLHGDVPEALVEHAAHHGVGGVVMSTHGRGVLERVLSPSVAQGLRRRLAAPMILVRPDSEHPTTDALRATARLQTVLIALDGSEDAEAALEEGLEVGGPEARYVLLRVVSPPHQLSTVYLPQAAILRHRDEERLRGEAADYLTRMESRVRGRGASFEKRLGVHSRPARLIVRAAEEVGADLIAVGSHGHGRLEEALFGSVTQDLLRESHTPVLVTRARA
jgi:nucleotide-binding universal stress UspA family protein